METVSLVNILIKQCGSKAKTVQLSQNYMLIEKFTKKSAENAMLNENTV